MASKPRQAEDLAVALHYSGHGAPTVTAKGRGEVAARIRELAEEHSIPRYESAELAQVLGRVDLGDEIPRALFVAVAEVIAFTYALRGNPPGGSPAAADDLGDRGRTDCLRE